jgi:hypothetical protein
VSRKEDRVTEHISHTRNPSGDPARRLADFDPRGQLRAFVTAGPASGATAEEAVLSWLISLPDGVDPARAAAGLGELPHFTAGAEGEADRLTRLLREIAAWPAERLPTARRSGRRVPA